MYFREEHGKSLLAIIVDDKNHEPLILVDDKGERYLFEKLWYKPYRNKTCCILCQAEEEEDGTITQKKFVFYFIKIGKELLLCYEENARKRQVVLSDYNNSLNNAGNRKRKKQGASFGASCFDGGAILNFLTSFAVLFLSCITLGLAYPAMICWRLRWQAKHTYISGSQLSFSGTANVFFLKYLTILILSVLTLGIYYVVVGYIQIVKWKTEHTHFVGINIATSSFDGMWYDALGVNLLSNFVSLITLGLGSYWAACYRQKWFCKHTSIDEYKLYFDGYAFELFCQCILWTLLTVITFGVYYFWLEVKEYDWQISHIYAEDPNGNVNQYYPRPLSAQAENFNVNYADATIIKR